MNRHDPETRQRRSIRIKGYDYSGPGAYFITIVTYQREPLFGDVANGAITLNQCGRIVQSCWEQIPDHFVNIHIDVVSVMPNHLHGIIFIRDIADAAQAATRRGTACRARVEAFGQPTRNSIPTIVRSFKAAAARQINDVRNTQGCPVWQRNYYEHVVRDDAELIEIRGYVLCNPANWVSDMENPKGLP